MDAAIFLEGLERLGIDFYTGVPDSLLQPFCDTLYAALLSQLQSIRDAAGKQLCFVEIALKQGSRSNLGRPKTTPRENLQQLMAYLKTQGEKA